MQDEIMQFIQETNEDLFLPAYQENDYLVHTTPFSFLKQIVKDGFLTGDASKISRLSKWKTVHHPNQVCFSSLPERHLSSMPQLSILTAQISNDTYLRFKIDYLRRFDVRPILYKFSAFTLKRLEPEYHQRLITGEVARREYGDLFERFVYDPIWMIENEWRIYDREVPLPEDVEIFVSNYRQKYVISAMIKAKIDVDPLLHRATSFSNKRWRLTHWFDVFLSNLDVRSRHIEWDPSKRTMTLYDVFPKGNEWEKICDLEPEDSRKILEVAERKTLEALASHFTNIGQSFNDIVVYLDSKTEETTFPNHIWR